MLAGVTIEKPETVSIDAGVRIGMDTVVEPFTRISGSTTIGEHCKIGACSIIEDSALGDRVLVGPFTWIAASRIEDAAQVGPYARLRMDAHVEPGAHIGNFVELKKTRLGAGPKAMHLAYLGRFRYRTKVNIGAGTITCNYDGAKKAPHYHRRWRLCREQFHTSCARGDWRRSVPRRRLRDHEDSSP